MSGPISIGEDLYTSPTLLVLNDAKMLPIFHLAPRRLFLLYFHFINNEKKKKEKKKTKVK